MGSMFVPKFIKIEGVKIFFVDLAWNDPFSISPVSATLCTRNLMIGNLCSKFGSNQIREHKNSLAILDLGEHSILFMT